MSEILLLNTVIFAGALVQGMIGFGLGVVCASTLFLINPSYLPAPLIILSMFLTASITLLNREELSLALVRWPLAGQAIGVMIAAWAVAWLDKTLFGLVFALLLLVAVALTIFRFRITINPLTGSLCGLISGFSGTIIAVGGPPMALLFHSLTPRAAVINLSTFFLVGCVMSLLALAVVGRLDWSHLILALQLLPGLCLGYFTSRFALRSCPPALVKGATVTLSGALGMYLLIKYAVLLLVR